MAKRVYGYIRDRHDTRDLMLAESPLKGIFSKPLPDKVDLRASSPPVYNQLDVGSCTGNALAFNYQYDEPAPSWIPSRLFIYYQERVIEHTTSEDAGAQIRDGIKALYTYGVCAEKTWPYVTTKFAVKPSAAAYKEALGKKIKAYYRLNQKIDELRSCLANNRPVVFGFSVYESFESDEVAKTGFVEMPKAGEQELGGHAVALVGYDHPAQRFIVRNSWGSDWGIAGYFTMPYAYVLSPSLASDFWYIQKV